MAKGIGLRADASTLCLSRNIKTLHKINQLEGGLDMTDEFSKEILFNGLPVNGKIPFPIVVKADADNGGLSFADSEKISLFSRSGCLHGWFCGCLGGHKSVKNGLQGKVFELFSFMGVFGPSVHLQALENVPLELVLMNHADNSLLDYAGGVGGANAANGGAPQVAPVLGVVDVFLLFLFVASQDNLVGIDDHHIVPHVEMGRVGGLVLAA